MLSLFRKAYFFNYLIGFVFIIVCWLPAFFIPQDTVASEVLKYDTILKAGFTNVYLLNFLGLFVTLISSLILNHLNTEYGMTGKLMTIGVFFFSMLSVSLSPFAIMNPFILINFFLFFFIRNLFRLPIVENPITLVFNSSLMLGFASLYFIKILFLIPVIWIALIIHRTNSWRNYISSLIGIAVPYLFIVTWYFWSDQLGDFILKMKSLLIFTFNIGFTMEITDIIILTTLTIFLIVAVLKTMARLTEKNINLRRNLIICIYFLMITVVTIILFGPGLNSLLIAVIPASIILSNAFHNIRKIKIYNFSFAVLAIFIIINQYLKLFLQ